MPVAVEDRGGTVALMPASLFLLGTWPALLTLLERRGRLPQHIYLDYSITNLVIAVLMAVAFGQVGYSRQDFFTQLTQMQDNWPSVLIAMAGGLALSLGNLVSQYAWAFAGLSLTNVICASMTVVSGTTINYFLDGRINRAEILFPGVVCFLMAVFLGAAVHSSNAKDDEQKLSIVQTSSSAVTSDKAKLLPAPEESKNGDEEDYSASNELKPGTAEFIIQVEERRSIKVLGHRKLLGLSLVFFAGACFSLFSPAINLATNDQWRALRKGVPHLLVYTAFSLKILLE